MKIKTLILLTMITCILMISWFSEAKYHKQKQTKKNEIIFTKTTWVLHQKMQDLWYSSWNATIIIKKCKQLEKQNKKYDAKTCVVTASFIWKAESWACNNAFKNNCWGMRNQRYKTIELAFDRWLKSYKKYWYKNLQPKDFYWPNSKTKYCIDEHSSNTVWYCPNGLKWSNLAYNYLKNEDKTKNKSKVLAKR